MPRLLQNVSHSGCSQANLFLTVQGQYDRIHVGACCPLERLHSLMTLLKPTGGLIVSPVAPSDLQAITVKPDGRQEVRVLSQVRYSDLEVGAESWLC